MTRSSFRAGSRTRTCSYGSRGSRFRARLLRAGKPVAAICHGPWMLVEADVVRGRRVTSWPSLKTDIRNAGGLWEDSVASSTMARDEPQAGRLAGLLFQARRGVPRRYSRGADGDRGTHRSVSRAGHAARVGCSGWNYESWRVRCTAARRRTAGSASTQMFDTVEVNSSFYRLPTIKAVQAWADATPDDFLFAIKASRYLTRVKRLRDLEDGTARLDERIEPLVQARKPDRSSGSCRSTSTATTRGSPTRCACSHLGCTRSNSGIPAGSPTTSTTSSHATMSPSSSLEV